MIAACPRCRTGEVVAVLRVPYSWTNTSGKPVRGRSDILLCTRCDAADPVTGPLITHFTVHGTVPDGDDLLLRWIDQAKPRKPDEHALRAEFDAWRQGDL
ncbi:DUF6300 family protein [Sinosporangium siamense]|uniref:Uncharacterized protein n=1 Tax=Sinosporangium siamense TaxID=1367973 RepID=A0A919RI39_9ACTN|nr:DUF6300 family protein [Sinosporangium siamense]GII94296.1 hypothetical protein Ssi02_45270 [Sinosporangium siamense]